ncbi:hypothetical protein MMC10_002701 [Thelotrema lepadinum]|nr:hypothetical protein [Thelotrema lepadinum]
MTEKVDLILAVALLDDSYVKQKKIGQSASSSPQMGAQKTADIASGKTRMGLFQHHEESSDPGAWMPCRPPPVSPASCFKESPSKHPDRTYRSRSAPSRTGESTSNKDLQVSRATLADAWVDSPSSFGPRTRPPSRTWREVVPFVAS